MLETISRDHFAQHINTGFHVRREGAPAVALTLTEVSEQKIQHAGGKSYESFSLFFMGPKEYLLQQKSYVLEHAALGTLDIFLVPVAQEGGKIQYQAAFNRMMTTA